MLVRHSRLTNHLNCERFPAPLEGLLMGAEKQIDFSSFDRSPAIFDHSPAIAWDFHSGAKGKHIGIRGDRVAWLRFGSGSRFADLFLFPLHRAVSVDGLHQQIPLPAAALLAFAVSGRFQSNELALREWLT